MSPAANCRRYPIMPLQTAEELQGLLLPTSLTPLLALGRVIWVKGGTDAA